MYILLLAFVLAVSGCVEGAATKPLTPTETQVITQVVAKRLIAPKLKDQASRLAVLRGIATAKTMLTTLSPAELLAQLPTILGPKYADIAALIVVLAKERIDVTQIPEIEGKAYLWAILTGVEGGLQ
jgi:hypothetical protein